MLKSNIYSLRDKTYEVMEIKKLLITKVEKEITAFSSEMKRLSEIKENLQAEYDELEKIAFDYDEKLSNLEDHEIDYDDDSELLANNSSEPN